MLRGEHVTLRPIAAGDAEAVFANLGDEEAMELTGTRQRFTLEQVRAFCARVAEANDRLDYAVTLPDDPSYRGEVVLNDIDWDNRSARLPHRPERTVENRGKGYGPEAAGLLLKHAFNALQAPPRRAGGL